MAYTLNRRIAELIDANGQLTAGKIAADYITNAHIADNTLTTAQLHTSFVIGSSHIPANTVTINHLAVTDGTANQVLKTDGSGTLSFTTIETNSISQGNTNVTVSDTGTDGKITMTTEGTARWEVTPTGHILPLLDDTYDIGSASKKIRDIYVSTGSIKMGADTVLSINSDGDFEINDASGDPKKIKVDEIEIGTGTDKLILKRGTDGKLESRKKVNGTLQAAEKLFSIASHTTDDITEGSSKLFYTDARTRAAISGTGSLSYNSSTGVMSFTMPAQNTSNITEGTNLYYTDARADARVALIVDSSPAALNTLNELAAALGDDPNFATTVSTSIGTKLPLAGGALTGAVTTNSTFDGRNVSVDGSKLDTIATSANNYSFPYSISQQAGNSTVVRRHDSGYIYANYFNTTPNTVSSGVTQVCVETGNDGFIRHGTPAAVRSFLNVADGANNYSLPFTNNSGNWNTAYGWGNHASAGYITNSGGTTASTVNTVVKRDGSGDINARLLRSEYDTTNASIGYIMTQVDTASNNYVRPSTPAQLRSALNVANGANNYSLPATVLHSDAYKMTGSGFKLGLHSGAGGTTFGANHYSMGVDIANNSWSNPHYSDLIIGYHTGIRIGAAYGGTRFYNNSPTTDTNNTGNGNGAEVLLMTVGGHAAGTGVKVHQNLIVGTTSSFAGVADFNGGHGGINITSTSILSAASSTWTGNPGANGKIQYHSNRWYIVSDSSSNRIVQFRRDGADKSYIDNNGTFVGSVSGNATTATTATTATNSNALGGYGINTSDTNNQANKVVRTQANGYIHAGWINTISGVATSAARVYCSQDGYIRYLAPAAFMTSIGALAKAGGTTSGTITLGTQNALVANNYGRGLFGIYTSTRYQHVWSMGTAYKTSDDGTSYGNMYGLTYTHTNVGTGTNQAIAGLSHQLQGRANGTLWWALGNGIWTTGSVQAASFLYNSDRVLKKNIKPIDGALNTVLALNGVAYTLKKTEKNSIGFIAQEVEKILPDMVEGEEGKKMVNYGQMVALLTEAMREQQNMIVALQEEVKGLKNASK